MNRSAEKRETLSVPEAGARLGISRAAAYRAARQGDLPAIRVGGRLLVLREPFERLLRGKEGSSQQ